MSRNVGVAGGGNHVWKSRRKKLGKTKRLEGRKGLCTMRNKSELRCKIKSQGNGYRAWRRADGKGKK